MISIIIIIFLIVLGFLLTRSKRNEKYEYNCYVLTLPESTQRIERFFKHHDSRVPIEIVYGQNTRKLKDALEFEEYVDPHYFEQAVEMDLDSDLIRPDTTYFNLGAIGCCFSHLSIINECPHKYALIFEDNMIIKTPRFYDEVQKVLDKLGNDFEMCFFHCTSRAPVQVVDGIEKVKWISSMKCRLVNVENMKKFTKYYLPMDNHIDNKTEEIIDKGARVFYKDMRRYIQLDRSQQSTIGHRHHGKKEFFSRVHPELTLKDLKWGY